MNVRLKEDLYFNTISTCIENEGIGGLLLNKLNFIDDSLQFFINTDDKVPLGKPATDADAAADDDDESSRHAHDEVNCKDLVNYYKSRNLDLKNPKLCSELTADKFRFIGWNLETNVSACFSFHLFVFYTSF